MLSDQVISQWIYDNISSNLTISSIAKFLSNITSWGQLWIVILISLTLYDYFKHKKINLYYLYALIPVILGWTLSDYLLKVKVARVRPYQEMEIFKTLMDQIGYKYPSGFSFPSGHTLIAFASAFILSKKLPKYTIGFYVLASIIGLSRIILGAHYFSDVLGGIGLGTIIGVLSCLFADFMEKRIKIPLKKKQNAA